MSEQTDFDNPTLDEIQRFRRQLFEKLTFEPVVDDDFVRPAAKLRALVQDSEALMNQLRVVVDNYDDLLASLTRLIAVMKEIQPVMGAALEIAFTPLPLAHFRYASPTSEIRSEEYEEGHARYVKRESLRSIAQALTLRFHSFLSPGDLILQVRVAGSRLEVLRFWAFVARVTQRVAKGNEHLFESHLVPENIRELLSQGTEKAIEQADLPNPVPFLAVFKAIYAHIGRKEARERQREKFVLEMDTDTFLVSYFNWWTDGNGLSTVKSVVADLEKIAKSQNEAVQTILTQSREFIERLREFKTLLNEIISHPQDEIGGKR